MRAQQRGRRRQGVTHVAGIKGRGRFLGQGAPTGDGVSILVLRRMYVYEHGPHLVREGGRSPAPMYVRDSQNPAKICHRLCVARGDCEMFALVQCRRMLGGRPCRVRTLNRKSCFYWGGAVAAAASVVARFATGQKKQMYLLGA